MADAYVWQSAPTANYGNQTILHAWAGTDSDSEFNSYLRFNVTGLDGSIVSAKLRLYAWDTNSDGFLVRQAVDDNWTESEINFSNAPAVGSIINTHGAITTATWIEIDVTSFVNGEGIYTLVLTGGSNSRLRFRSRENVNAPQLIVETGSSVTATPSATLQNTTTPTATSSPTSLPTATPTSTATSPPTSSPTPTPTSVSTSTPTPIASATATSTPPLGSTVNFESEADAYVWEGAPTANYGSQTILHAWTGGNPNSQFNSYVRFNVAGLSGPVTQAVLRLYAWDSNNDGFRVHAVVDNSWIETGTSGITYQSAPSLGSLIETHGPITTATWLEVDVTNYINGDGEYSFGLTGDSASRLRLRSRESSQPPELVIETGAGVTSTPTPTNTSIPTPTATNTPLPTNTPTATNTPLPTNTPTATSTPLPTNTPTATSTPLPTNTPTATSTPSPTSTPLPAVSLNAIISPTTAFAGEPVLQLIVEARDANGNLAAGYRGRIELVESASSTLPDVRGFYNEPDYTFTAADAGRAVFTFAFLSGGVHNVYVYDWANSSCSATSNDVTVAEVYLTAAISPATGVRGDEVFTLTVEARDENGDLYPGYRGRVEFQESAASTLPDVHGSLYNEPDYTFTAADAGRAQFTFAFNENGSQNVYVYDWDNTGRNAASNSVAVTDPPPPARPSKKLS
ncbi:MAG: DNRLRE domain-containing protein, partial [Chloroflexi bacterium]|nr:DNRLRE domain-containing protein [Chloroflexota bacterium]